MNIASSGSSLSRDLLRILKEAFVRLLAASAILVALVPAAGAEPGVQPAQGNIRFEISLPAVTKEPSLTGRIFLFVSHTNQPEPRLQYKSFFGEEVRGAAAGQSIVMHDRVLGYPEHSLGDLTPGDYVVQALLNIYTEFPRADGHTIWAHMDQWEGQNFAVSPGNLISKPQLIHLEAGTPAQIHLKLVKELPPIEVPRDTEWVQRIKFQSPRLTRFWGHPTYLGATVLLPKGYAEHPEMRYPGIYIQGHFSLGAPFGFSPTPAPNGKKSWARQRQEAAAQHLPPPAPPAGTQAIGALPNTETGHEFYDAWIADDFPRVIAVTFQHPTPYFDDSYGVNSPNCGPYGDAIMQELIPALERRYRMINQANARVLTGSSTGGWGALAMQLYHPDFFGGAWAFSPDPVDFRRYYGGVNIYEDDNAFVEKPGIEFKGGGLSNRRGSQRAAVLGWQEGRFEWWKHTPTGTDGYPLPVWDLATGKVDRAVVQAMREHDFDLRDYLERNWPRLGPKLIGKLHVCAADTDSFYSNLAVHLLEDFLRTTRDPHETGSFQYGPPGSHHGWQPTTNGELVRTMAKYMVSHRPSGE